MWWHLFASLPKAERDKAAGLRRLVGLDGHPIALGDDGPHLVEFLIMPEAFRNEVCKGLDPNFVAEILNKAGHLKTDKDGRLLHKLRLPGICLTRVFHVLPSVFDSTAAAD